MATPGIVDFVRAAKAGGASDEALVALLKQRGWSEPAIYEALGGYYEGVTGMPIPERRTASGSAKEAFLYLLTFATLGTWTIALGSLLFTLIEVAFPDAAVETVPVYTRYSISGQLASIIVAFPIFLLVTRITTREIRLEPERLDSPVRKWLTYIALFIAAGVVVGDLITFLAYFLRGELTVRFALKVIAVLGIAGGVFWYYLAAMRPEGFVSRAQLAIGLASAIVVLSTVAGGILQLGSPQHQRGIGADTRRVADLRAIRVEVSNYERMHSVLPVSLEQVTTIAPHLRTSDPLTGQHYGYRRTSDNGYELCAVFDAKAKDERTDDFWSHPAGRHCFALDTRIAR